MLKYFYRFTQLPKRNSKLLPVIVFIPAGRWIGGSNDHNVYNPTFLLDKDILLVAPNYRLGALGFLSTGDEVAPGNWGLKDQILALKWVQKNIKYFGGDPDRVTLAGDSNGGASVEHLALSNLTEGYFEKSQLYYVDFMLQFRPLIFWCIMEPSFHSLIDRSPDFKSGYVIMFFSSLTSPISYTSFFVNNEN